MGNDGKKVLKASAPSIHVRAPVSDETGGRNDNSRDVNGNHETLETSQHQEGNGVAENDDGDWRDDEDGNFSDYSGDSFDSAFERMAASTTGDFNIASSPNPAYPPMGAFGASAMFDYSSPLDMWQQGALMRLNKMLTGDDSLDTSVIDNCSEEEFHKKIDQLARSRGQSPEDASFGSIVDALFPYVQERCAEKARAQARLNIDGEKTSTEYSQGEDADDRPNEAGDAHPIANGETIASFPTQNGKRSVVNNAERLDQHDSKSLIQETSDSDQGSRGVTDDTRLNSDAATDEDGEDLELRDGNGAQERIRVTWEDEIDGARPKAKLSAEDQEYGNGGSEPSKELCHLQQVSELPEETQIRPVAKLSDDAEVNGVEVDGEATDRESEQRSEEENEIHEGGDDGDGKASEGSSSDLPALDYISSNSSGDEVSQEPSLRMNPVQNERSSPSLEPTTPLQQPRRGASVTSPSQVTISFADDSRHANGEESGAERNNEGPRDKLEIIRIQFLRLVLRLGQSTRNVVVEQVLYRLGLAEQLWRGGRGSSRASAFSLDTARDIAEEQEAAGPEELNFTCTIMLLGKTGVGKSATINSIFDEKKSETDAFSPSTKNVQVITGHVHGIKVRVIDTPGLLPAGADQRHNLRVMSSVKKFIRNQTPDIVLFVDRLDMQSRDFGDLPLLRTITDTFGAAVWFNAIVVLTHASSAPPDGPNGLPLSYEMFVAQRSHVVQQTIRQAAEDMRLMNPVSLVENHSSCRVNQFKERVLPNGQVWKPQLLLLCFASKVLAETNALLKLQDNTPGKPFGTGTRAPPLPFLLSSLLQSRAQVRLPVEQVGRDEPESDDDVSVRSSEDEDDEVEYDQLPPFRRLASKEFMELDEDKQCDYSKELAERERLFEKKLRKEESIRRKELRSRTSGAPVNQFGGVLKEALESDPTQTTTSLPVPLPDLVLPPTFDSDNPTHRYRYLETANQWLVRPVVESRGWDHDSGFDGMSLEKIFVVGSSVPVIVSGQFSKDKGDLSLNMECTTTLKHGSGKYTMGGLDMQTFGKDIAYTLRGETRFSSFKSNKTSGGLALTLLGDTISGGLKIEDRLIIGKRAKMVLSGGVVTGRNDVAYGGSVEATLKDQNDPLSKTMSSLGVSVMDWHGELAVGSDIQSQILLGKTMLTGRGNLNNRGAGQITIKASSSEQFRMALISVLPIVRVIVNRFLWAQSQ